jgi:hypothetical protein
LDLLPKESREKYACSAGGIQEMDMMKKKLPANYGRCRFGLLTYLLLNTQSVIF